MDEVGEAIQNWTTKDEKEEAYFWRLGWHDGFRAVTCHSGERFAHGNMSHGPPNYARHRLDEESAKACMQSVWYGGKLSATARHYKIILGQYSLESAS